MHHLLQQCCLPALAHLRNGLRAPLWVLMALCLVLGPAGIQPAAAARLAMAAAAGAGEEAPAGGSAEQETPAKLRRVTTLQVPRAACLRAAPPRPVARTVDMAAYLQPLRPGALPVPPTALPTHWRSQRSQAPPPR
ncbi:hypothetical protein [Stenotrophomonas acidaminiphila]|uniref:hypothetical protein n=1 Tax=Stenotrophomonas acidaminiphila TaxID=128780 RepID=UPI0028A66889|nr:hypothetical protein [Stenotrophomonas acidaminiphila]